MRGNTSKWILLAVLINPLAFAAVKGDCKNCDCIHLPCPVECKPCCGLAAGTITAKTHDKLMLRSADGTEKTFTIGQETELKGDGKEGDKATVYFRKAGSVDKLAQKIIIGK